MHNPFFNAHHSPIGAFASLTLGFPGARGGLGVELAGPADQSVYVGLEASDGSGWELLPFADEADDERRRYLAGGAEEERAAVALLRPMPREQISRTLGPAVDTWRAGQLTLSIFSPVRPLPDPALASNEELRPLLLPAVFVALTVDNSRGVRPRRAVFGYSGADPYSAMRQLDGGLIGVAQGLQTAIVACDPGGVAAQGFDLARLLTYTHPENRQMGLGRVGALVVEAPPGERRTFRFAVCFHRAGIVTAGLEARYLYTRLFPTLEDVARYAVANIAPLIAACEQDDARFAGPMLSADQRLFLAHAIRAYYGSTQLLERAGKPLWVVNEGEYRMINTFDLTVDHLFFELRMHPWAVRDVLDLFVERYSYTDEAHLPGDPTPYPGGIAFTHDMGVANVFAAPDRSSYEQAGLSGCFSYMSHEQLVNWVLCAVTYAEHTGDQAWLARHLDTLEACLASMLNRDHPDPARRDGVMSLDGGRTGGGAEITTYDSLDASLGQARGNLYLAGKCWAAYVLLERSFAIHGRPKRSGTAGEQAMRCAATIARAAGPDGALPAILGENVAARIIPAIEGLVFPLVAGCAEALDPNGRFGGYISALRCHLEAILVPGVCRFADGGWKLSSTSDNSWLSKIALCQHVARHVLGLPTDPAADAAHVAWLTHPELSFWGWSDQIVAGRITASRYYPRGVTAILWLET